MRVKATMPKVESGTIVVWTSPTPGLTQKDDSCRLVTAHPDPGLWVTEVQHPHVYLQILYETSEVWQRLPTTVLPVGVCNCCGCASGTPHDPECHWA